ncbi:hypothetical protein GCM10028806_19510 [Spirosoma terrae]
MKTQRLGVYSKTDFLLAYGVTMPTFEKWIEDIKEPIGWKKGQKQKFPPKLVQIIFDHLGEP